MPSSNEYAEVVLTRQFNTDNEQQSLMSNYSRQIECLLSTGKLPSEKRSFTNTGDFVGFELRLNAHLMDPFVSGFVALVKREKKNFWQRLSNEQPAQLTGWQLGNGNNKYNTAMTRA